MQPTQAITDGIVVRHDYVLKLPTGEAKLVSVIVGAPYQAGGYWQCPCELQGIHGRFSDMPGVNQKRQMNDPKNPGE